MPHSQRLSMHFNRNVLYSLIDRSPYVHSFLNDQVFHSPVKFSVALQFRCKEMAWPEATPFFVSPRIMELELTACTWFEKLLSLPLESTAVVT